MLALPIHVDVMTDENGPLQGMPGSQHSRANRGAGVENRNIILAVAGVILAMRP